MKNNFILAAAQIHCIPGEREVNWQKAEFFIEQAARLGAEIVVLPECCDLGYDLPLLKSNPDLVIPGESSHFFTSLAKKHSVSIVAGIVERDARNFYNTAFCVDPTGNAHSYRKSHLFCTPPILENEIFTGGDGGKVLNWSQGKVAPLICYDLRFPEMARKLALAGAEVFAVPSAWPLARVDTLRVLCRARAIENQCFLVSANQVGRHSNGLQFAGASMIISADGAILAEADITSEKVIMAEVKEETLVKFREHIPVYQHRRPELY